MSCNGCPLGCPDCTDPSHRTCEMPDCGRRVCIGHKAGRASSCCGAGQGILIDDLAFCAVPCAGVVADEFALDVDTRAFQLPELPPPGTYERRMVEAFWAMGERRAS